MQAFRTSVALVAWRRGVSLKRRLQAIVAVVAMILLSATGPVAAEAPTEGSDCAIGECVPNCSGVEKCHSYMSCWPDGCRPVSVYVICGEGLS